MTKQVSEIAKRAEAFCEANTSTTYEGYKHRAMVASPCMCANLERLISEATQEMLEALRALVNYTAACEGMLNASASGQVKAAEAILARYSEDSK